MPEPARDAVLATIATYEDALRRIAGKLDEHEALARHRGLRADAEDAASAYRLCARIATLALRQHHPEMKSDAVAAGKPSLQPRRARRRPAQTPRGPDKLRQKISRRS